MIKTVKICKTYEIEVPEEHQLSDATADLYAIEKAEELFEKEIEDRARDIFFSTEVLDGNCFKEEKVKIVLESLSLSNIREVQGKTKILNFFIEGDLYKMVISYDSIVALIPDKPNKVVLFKDWNYSKTTTAHLLKVLRVHFSDNELNSDKIQKMINSGDILFYPTMRDYVKDVDSNLL